MPKRPVEIGPDSFGHWLERYLELAVTGLRPDASAKKIILHLGRFQQFFIETYGHDRLSACLRRDVQMWQTRLEQHYAPATVNNHLASLSGFTHWLQTHNPTLFPAGNPTQGVGEMPLPPLEPRALSDQQVNSLKNVCDRLEVFHRRRKGASNDIHTHARPWRDRAIVFFLLSTGLRREELVRLDLAQIEPNTVTDLRRVRKVRVNRVRGKGKTERTVFLSADARLALADYLDRERARDAGEETMSLFLSATGLPDRAPDGRLSCRAINRILVQIGRWHDAEQSDPTRRISPLRPHDLRHSFAFRLAQVTKADAYELERRLGHRSQRYIQRYTNPPEQVAAEYIEKF